MPIHTAAAQGHADLCKLLIEHGSSLTAKNKAGLTPGQLAEKHHVNAATRAVFTNPPKKVMTKAAR